MRLLRLPFFVFAFCLCFNDVIGAEVRIKSVDELIQFKDNVNEGKSYSGTTVFLDSDLDFTGKTFEPIGNSSLNYFNGTFDGQGHVISNLIMNSSSQYVGLFSNSTGLTIKNVILDSSCSITSSFMGSNDAYVGGIIGYCYAAYGYCNIENSVNMGSVSFSGTISSKYVHLGGIAGYLNYKYFDITLKNCANYGDVTNSGTSGNSYIGGIVGYSRGYPKGLFIYNSLNHGTITHNSTSSLNLGGIAGYTYYTTIENCVIDGKISSTKTSNIGRIVGYTSYDTYFNNCYYTSDLNKYSDYGNKQETPTTSNTLRFNSTSFQLIRAVSIGNYTGDSLIGVLNAYADYYDFNYYSYWLLNKENKTVSFTINGRSPFKLNSQVILLPSLASEGKLWFDGWYENSGLTTPLTSYEVSSNTELYGKFEENTNSYTITFETRMEGVSVAPITAPFNSIVTLPSDSIREHCIVAWWENKYGDKIDFIFTIPSYNITLYAVWKCTHIKTPEDLVIFSNSVNNGVDYSETTVFLNSDIKFTEETFEPIGYYNTYNDYSYFRGVFDGQGYVINNLYVNSSSQYVGLFGYSTGLTIRNVILGSSCSIISSYSGTTYNSVSTGGFIGQCAAPGNIENCVNMGNVTFSGYMGFNYNLYLGGIVGRLYSYSEDVTMKNCANYGDVKHPGGSSYASIGGLVGEPYGSSSKRAYIYNSINHGTITHSGTTSRNLYLGGIAGYTHSATIENCVSAGKISHRKATDSTYVGSVVGQVYDETTINYCYYTRDLSSYNKYGDKYRSPSESNVLEYDSTTSELGATVSVGSYSGISLVGALNGAADYYYAYREYSYWLFNKKKYAMSFIINGRTSPIKVNYPVILMPTLANEGSKIFDGWYTDRGLTTQIGSYEINKPTSFYATFMSFSNDVTFNVNGGNALSKSESKKEVTFDSTYGDLPVPTRTGFTFAGWFTAIEGGEEIKSEDIVTITDPQTLYAHWTAKAYIVTFDVNEGTSSKSSMNVTYDSTYGDLPTPTRTGFTFGGWFTDKTFANEITSDSTVSTPNDHTLYAKWEIAVYQLTFIFDNGIEPEERSLNYNDPITYPAEPVKEGHSFNGWSETIESMPANDLTITALWIANNYTITFIFGNGTEPEKRTLNYNDSIIYPEDVIKEGHSFNGWSETIEFMPANDLTITAQWTANQYTLRFDLNNGEPVIEEVHHFNDPITYPAEPVKEGRTFSGWSETIKVMPARDLTIKAEWAEDVLFMEITLGTTDMSEDEIIDLLKKYTNADFTTDKLEIDKSDGITKITIKFSDSDEGNKFADKVDEEINEGGDTYFRKVTSIKKEQTSLSHCIYPFSIFIFNLFA